MRLLVLDCALGRCTAAVIDEETVAAVRTEALTRGHEARLPVMARDVMREAGAGPDLVAVTVGPGSFTGIRAALALGHGIGLALGVPVTGVTVGEAIADAFPGLTHRALWVVTPSRRGHVFLEQNGVAESLALDALPAPAGPVALAGPGAIGVAAQLAARDFNVMLTDARFPSPRHIAAVARRRHASGADRPAQPLYVDPPEAKPPAGGLRPMPLPASGA